MQLKPLMVSDEDMDKLGPEAFLAAEDASGIMQTIRVKAN